MSSTKINRRDQFNKIIQELGAFYQTPIRALINNCYDKHGATEADIANVLGTDSLHVKRKYPKLEEERNGLDK